MMSRSPSHPICLFLLRSEVAGGNPEEVVRFVCVWSRAVDSSEWQRLHSRTTLITSIIQSVTTTQELVLSLLLSSFISLTLSLCLFLFHPACCCHLTILVGTWHYSILFRSLGICKTSSLCCSYVYMYAFHGFKTCVPRNGRKAWERERNYGM